ncbi:hypothetical protein LCGC14_1917580 [marine sediment metagenome]|uniref:Uncharacterized protein n=1 Tax=marine sediment metagenome TaxID=412755 RepID=A0A0F9FRJ5_9ZZZZ
MKLAKATEILKDVILDEAYQSGTDTYHALVLSIEALEYIQDQRNEWLLAVFEELPSETPASEED